MKPSSRRPLLATLFAAVHAAVMLVGPSLHELPGASHDAGMGGAACEQHRGEHAPATHRSTDDCQLCHFLAQGQLTTESATETGSEQVTHLGPIATTTAPAPSCQNLARPRAPPRDALA